MPQIFHPSANTISRFSIYGCAIIVAVLSFALYEIGQSPYYTRQNLPQPQPVPFSHRHHAAELGIDCRYCHDTVETSAFAGIPSTQTCMTCHSQIWTNSPMLKPVRDSYETGRSISWTRVNALPDFAYFNHSIHVAKGIGCTTCHGAIGTMTLTWQATTMQMSWCLGCHREPEKYVRPRDQVFNINYRPPPNQMALGRKLVREYKIQSLTSCDTCHR
ncbi:MAG TPA: cytochrome c3 family protein [Candidatus Acidoferrales bacterium]|nr:cytochrome c3 family protein [Candidatus Acidoferrales bacterium]